MPVSFERDILESDLAAVEGLLKRVGARDRLARLTLSKRKSSIEAELHKLADTRHTTASVLLSFEGGPVRGSYGIDADFAGRALQDYQELLAKQAAAHDNGGLARKGPVPDRQMSRLNITNVVHGSFGFLLEEDGADQPQMIDSALLISVKKITDLLKAFSDLDQHTFEQALSEIDPRVFVSLKNFIEDLYRGGATLKLIEDDRQVVFDSLAVATARERIIATEVSDSEVILNGELLGVVPIQRRFDFRVHPSQEDIKGKVGEQFSADYLERLHKEQTMIGRPARAKLNRRTIRRIDGRLTEEWTLIDLTLLNEA
jgi:hypothetical protein